MPQVAQTVDMPINATIRIPESLWKRAKITAIERGCTVAELVQEALEKTITGADSAASRKR